MTDDLKPRVPKRGKVFHKKDRLTDPYSGFVQGHLSEFKLTTEFLNSWTNGRINTTNCLSSNILNNTRGTIIQAKVEDKGP